jgi:hypothetical protein
MGGSAGSAFRKKRHIEIAPGALPEEVSDIIFGDVQRAPKRKTIKSDTFNAFYDELTIPTGLLETKPILIGKFGYKTKKIHTKPKNKPVYTQNKPTTSMKQLDKKMDNILYGAAQKWTNPPKVVGMFGNKPKKSTTKPHRTPSMKQLDKKMDEVIFGNELEKQTKKKQSPKQKKMETYGL